MIIWYKWELKVELLPSADFKCLKKMNFKRTSLRLVLNLCNQIDVTEIFTFLLHCFLWGY